jgi:hypothetical protein
MPSPTRNPSERPTDDQRTDHAFLHWFEARLATSGPDIPEQDVLDYLVAVALYERSWGLLLEPQ